jgi:hypothetical protein
MSVWRRYEILLPLRFNDGQPVPQAVIGDTLLELENRFGAVTWEVQPVRGRWSHEGRTFQDDSLRVFVDVPDRPEVQQFFLQFKERLKERFRQIDIWVTTFRIDVL